LKPFGRPTENSKQFELERNHRYDLNEKNNEKYYFGPHLYLQIEYQKLSKSGKLADWIILKEKLKPDTEYFDSTIDEEYNLRPQHWFELEYNMQC
jgi:hypothetical protein